MKKCLFLHYFIYYSYLKMQQFFKKNCLLSLEKVYQIKQNDKKLHPRTISVK